jgi:hypothetical protein
MVRSDQGDGVFMERNKIGCKKQAEIYYAQSEQSKARKWKYD